MKPNSPVMYLTSFLQDSAAELLAAIRAAAQANLNQLIKHAASAPPVPAKLHADVILPAGNGQAMAQTTERVVATPASATPASVQMLATLRR